MRSNLSARYVLAAILFLTIPINTYAGTYYVSPSGSDSNPGTQLQPLRSFYSAVKMAKPGDTFIFEDGVYVETQYPWIEQTPGLATATTPIVFKSRNKYGAVLSFQNMINEKILIRQQYVTIQDFEITQNVKGGVNDHLVYAYVGSAHISIIGNRIHNATTDCVKGTKTSFLLVKYNICYDNQNEGIDVLNSYDVTVVGNELWNIGTAAILLKGGGRDFKVFNNYIHASSPMTFGIVLGGQSCTGCTFDYSSSGYEAYNSVAYDNVVVSNPAGAISQGLTLMGAADTTLSNNVIIGANTGIVLTKAADAQYGWAWDPMVRNPVVVNNIVQNCTAQGTSFSGIQGTLTHDYNTYFNCSNASAQAHGLTSDPLFVDSLRDWHLRAGSLSAGSGAVVQPRTGYQGAVIDVSLDRSGTPRIAPWDRGVYVTGATTSLPAAPTDVRVVR
jgi:hypothetical protein